jgi:hypothetical protein
MEGQSATTTATVGLAVMRSEAVQLRKSFIVSACKECESGGIGRRTRLRIWRGNPWGFESPLSHHNFPGTGSKEEAGRQDRPFQCPQVSHDAQYGVAVFTVKIAWGLQLLPDGASQLRMLLISFRSSYRRALFVTKVPLLFTSVL